MAPVARASVVSLLLIAAAAEATASDAGLPDGMDPGAFFLRRIRPVLEEQCWRCHGARKQRNNLRLDSREAVLRGGHVTDVEPGHPEKSRLIDAISYDDGELQMPPDGKLGDQEIADFATWVRLGVPWAEARGATGNAETRRAAAATGESPSAR